MIAEFFKVLCMFFQKVQIFLLKNITFFSFFKKRILGPYFNINWLSTVFLLTSFNLCCWHFLFKILLLFTVFDFKQFCPDYVTILLYYYDIQIWYKLLFLLQKIFQNSSIRRKFVKSNIVLLLLIDILFQEDDVEGHICVMYTQIQSECKFPRLKLL